MKTYLIKIPRYTTKATALFEQVFIELHETLRSKQVSFEIVASAQNIGFCFTADFATTEVVASQFYAAIPDADIVEIPDFAKKIATGAKLAYSELSLVRKDIFPIRDYRDVPGDSLAAVLCALSSCRPSERVFIQITCRPEGDSWLHHLRLNVRRRLDRARHVFRVKYWFKKGVSATFQQKISEKLGQRLFRTNLRVACLSSATGPAPEHRIRAVFGALANFNTLDLNQIRIGRIQHSLASFRSMQNRELRNGFFFSPKELATLFHLPAQDLVPNLVHVVSQRAAPPPDLPSNQNDPDISFFAATNFRNQHVPFGIRRSDRRRHICILGKSGSGKSGLLELLIRSDILSGRAVGILDPYGDLVESALRMVPRSRVNDVVLFDTSDLNSPPSLNLLETVPEQLKARVSLGVIELFKQLLSPEWSPELEHLLRYTSLALLDSADTTLLSISPMLTERRYREKICHNIKDSVVKSFWTKDFTRWSEQWGAKTIQPVVNKLSQLLATNMIRNIVGQPKNRIDLRTVFDSRKILLIKIPKGFFGEESASLLGSIAISKLSIAAMSRADIPEAKRGDFSLYIDEFQHFAKGTFTELLTDARKNHLNLTIANQFLDQLPLSLQKALFGTIGTIISFRVGAEDAQVLARELGPRFQPIDLTNLAVREFALKMSVDGEIQEAFSGRTLAIKLPEGDLARQCVEHSRRNYTYPVDQLSQIRRNEQEELPSVLSQKKKPFPGPFPGTKSPFEKPMV